jgi:hypothetical protein
LSEEFSPELLKAAKRLRRACKRANADLDRRTAQGRWAQLQALYPPGDDGSGGIANAIRKTARPGSGSDKKRMGIGKTWSPDDKARTFRSRGLRRRPTSEVSAPAGALDDADDSTEVSGYDHEGAEVEDSSQQILDGVHGYRVYSDDGAFELDGPPDGVKKAKHAGHLLEVCLVCAHPLPLEWPQRRCEFLVGAPDTFLMQDVLPFFRDCRCNGCLRSPKRTRGRMRYCSADCRDRMDNAVDRATRRAQGKQTRTFDPAVDRLADFAVSMKLAARQTKSPSGYQSAIPERPPVVADVEPERPVLSVPYLHRNARSLHTVVGSVPKRSPLVFRPAAVRRECGNWRDVWSSGVLTNSALYQAQVLTGIQGSDRSNSTALIGNWSALDREMYCGEVQPSPLYESADNVCVGKEFPARRRHSPMRWAG